MKGRRLNIKRVIFFPLIVYSVYIFIDSFMPLFMIGFVIWLLYNWTSKRRFWWLINEVYRNGQMKIIFLLRILWDSFHKCAYYHCSCNRWYVWLAVWFFQKGREKWLLFLNGNRNLKISNYLFLAIFLIGEERVLEHLIFLLLKCNFKLIPYSIKEVFIIFLMLF